MSLIPFILAKIFEKGMKEPRSNPWDGLPPPLGWLWSEKFDGYRSRFMGESTSEFVSRANKVFTGVPEWFIMAMPPGINLDGELWVGRNNFESTGVVRKTTNKDPKEWIQVKYIVYDLPDEEGTFEQRINKLKKIVNNTRSRWNIIRKKLPEPFCNVESPLIMAEQKIVVSEEQLDKDYQEIIKNGGEGIMIRHPNSLYKDGRSDHLLKIKPTFDEEAIIIGHTEGKGKYKKMLGGFICEQLINMDTYHLRDQNENHNFTISGMDDEVRYNFEETHPIGTVINYEHSGKTKNGKPRFARYVRIREDVVIKDKIEEKSTSKRDNLIKILASIGNHQKANGENFKANAYFKVITGLKKIDDDSKLSENNIKEIKGVGESIYQKINTILKTGTCPQYESIQLNNDPKMIFMDIHGIGPVKAKELVDAGFTSIQQLREGDPQLNDKQVIGLNHYEELIQKIPREEIIEHEKFLKSALKSIDKNAELTIAGSYRRRKEESGDIDVLIKSEKKDTYSKFIKKLNKLGYLIDELALGPKKYNGICRHRFSGIARRIDIMYTIPSEYPFAVFYFTGSGDFNKMVRKLVNDKGMTINEYSLRNLETDEIVDYDFKVEKDIFNFLNLGYVEPWQRL